MRLNELHLILLCFLCAGAALFSPIDYAWIGPVSRSRWLAALAFALCVVSGSDPTARRHDKGARPDFSCPQVACFLSLVLCSDVQRVTFKNTYGQQGSEPYRPKD